MLDGGDRGGVDRWGGDGRGGEVRRPDMMVVGGWGAVLSLSLSLPLSLSPPPPPLSLSPSLKYCFDLHCTGNHRIDGFFFFFGWGEGWGGGTCLFIYPPSLSFPPSLPASS